MPVACMFFQSQYYIVGHFSLSQLLRLLLGHPLCQNYNSKVFLNAARDSISLTNSNCRSTKGKLNVRVPS